MTVSEWNPQLIWLFNSRLELAELVRLRARERHAKLALNKL